MVNIVNATQIGGGFRHYSGLLPAQPGDGGSQAQASVKVFHIPTANAAAIFRGDILVSASSAIGTQGAGDYPQNISAPSASVVIGNGGGSGLGNASEAPNATRWVPGDTTSVILGVCVGFAFTLYTAKNGYQYIPAAQESWVLVETDPLVEMSITMPTVPATAFNLILNGGIDVQANAGQQSTRFGISGVSLNPATFANTATLPLRLLYSGQQIGNDPTAPGFVAGVAFNQSRHFRAGGGFVAD